MSDGTCLTGPAVDLPAVTATQMAEVDRIMIEDLGIALVQMMENAGRSLAELTIARWKPERVVVLAGPGGNGGGGMAAACHLANRGSDVEVVLSDAARLTAVPAHQRAILDAMGVPVHDSAQLSAQPHDLLADAVVIDALLGYSLDGDPREPAAGLIRASRRTPRSRCRCRRPGWSPGRRRSGSCTWRTSRCPRRPTERSGSRSPHRSGRSASVA